MKTIYGLQLHNDGNLPDPAGLEKNVNYDNQGTLDGSDKGRMPPKAPDAYGIPQALILNQQCRFPLWGMKEKPTPLSLMCGEPVADGKCYCWFHHELCYRPASNGPLDGDAV